MKNYVILFFFLLMPLFSVTASGAGDPDNDQLLFNEALISYEENDYEKTAEQLKSLIVEDIDGFNEKLLMLTANNFYRLSKENLKNKGEADKALSNIENSIGFYKRIFQNNDKNKIAAHNLELALLLKENIKAAIEEEQKQNEQNESDRDKLDQLQEKQKQLAEDSQKGADDHKSDQEDLNEQTSEMKDNGSSSENEEYGQNMKNAEESQQKAMDALENKDFTQAEEFQNQAAQYLKEASDSLGDSSETEESQSDDKQESENEKDQIAKSIIENENNRESSSDNISGGIVVDRNW